MRCAPTASCSSASRRPSCRSPSAIFCIEGDERMRRIVGVISGNAEGASDVLRLDDDLRSRRRMVFNTAGGNSVLLDMPRAVHLHDGDGLTLDDGSIVRVEAASAALIEIRRSEEHTSELQSLMRISYA